MLMEQLKFQQKGVKSDVRINSQKYNFTSPISLEVPGKRDVFETIPPTAVYYLKPHDKETFKNLTAIYNEFNPAEQLPTQAARRRLLGNKIQRFNDSLSEFNQTLVPQNPSLLGSLKGAFNGLLEYIPLFSSTSEGQQNQRRHLLDSATLEETVSALERTMGNGVKTENLVNTVIAFDYMQAFGLVAGLFDIISSYNDAAFFVDGDRNKCENFLIIGSDLLQLTQKLSFILATALGTVNLLADGDINLDLKNIIGQSKDPNFFTASNFGLFGSLLTTIMLEIIKYRARERNQSRWPDVKKALNDEGIASAIEDALKSNNYRPIAEKLLNMRQSFFFDQNFAYAVQRNPLTKINQMLAGRFSLQMNDEHTLFCVNPGYNIDHFNGTAQKFEIVDAAQDGQRLVGAPAPVTHNVNFKVQGGEDIFIGTLVDGWFSFDGVGLLAVASTNGFKIEQLDDLKLIINQQDQQDQQVQQVFSKNELIRLSMIAFNQANIVGGAPDAAGLAITHASASNMDSTEPKVQNYDNWVNFEEAKRTNVDQILIYNGSDERILNDISNGFLSPVDFGPGLDVKTLETFLSSDDASRKIVWRCFNSVRNANVRKCDFLLQMIHAACCEDVEPQFQLNI